MKLTGQIVGTGKLGNIVAAQYADVTIARQYRDTIANPSTPAQVDQRARLKLMSQVSAALAPVIAIPKQGLRSSRNLFSKKNFDLVYANGGVAQISYENLQLTAGNAGLPQIVATRSVDTGIVVQLADAAAGRVTRMAYAIFVKGEEGDLIYLDSQVVDAAGENDTYPATFAYSDGELVLYAYGMRDLNAAATAKYGNYSVKNGSDLARLIMQRSLSTADYSFTKTRGATMPVDSNEIAEVADGRVRVFLTGSGGGIVTGAGTYEQGAEVTINTTNPDSTARFQGWQANGGVGYVSTSPSYTFTAVSQVDLVAVWTSGNSGTDDGGIGL